MLTLIALYAAVFQEPATSARPSVAPGLARFVILGADRPGSLDKDGDGEISREEFAAPVDERFLSLDADGDGRLSIDELTADRGTSVSGHYSVRIVRNAKGRGGLALGDAGGDFPTVVLSGVGPGEDVRPEVIILDGTRRHAAVRRPDTEEGGRARFEIHRFGGSGGEHDLDADNDGRISEAEFTRPLREAFGRLDADGSGFVEEGERGQGDDANLRVYRFGTRAAGED